MLTVSCDRFGRISVFLHVGGQIVDYPAKAGSIHCAREVTAMGKVHMAVEIFIQELFPFEGQLTHQQTDIIYLLHNGVALAGKL